MRIQEVDRIKTILMLFLFGLLSTSVYSQQSEEVESDQDQEEGSFFNDMNEERFGSNYEGSRERTYDYDQGTSRRGAREMNIMGEQRDYSRYQYQGEEKGNGGPNQVNGSNANRLIIGSQGGEWNQAPSIGNQNPNVNIPSVKNPYPENPGVKSPRNMDAVPDNGDDPSDVPLDGSLLVLIFSGLFFGYRKK